MKTNYNIFVVLAFGLSFGGCLDKGKSNTLEQLQSNTSNSPEEVNSTKTITYIDSITAISSQIEQLMATQQTKKGQVNFLTRKSDSITTIVNQLDGSLARVKSQKIEPNINGVSTALKGQKENLLKQKIL